MLKSKKTIIIITSALLLIVCVSTVLLLPRCLNRHKNCMERFIQITGAEERNRAAEAMAYIENGEFGEAMQLLDTLSAGNETCKEDIEKIRTYAVAERDEFRQLTKGLILPWPEPAGIGSPDILPEELEGRAKQFERFSRKADFKYYRGLAAVFRGLLLYHNKKYSECVDWFDNFKIEDLPAEQAGYIAASCAWKNNSPSLALKIIEKTGAGIEGSAFSAELKLLKSDILFNMGKTAEAIAEAASAGGGAGPIVKGKALLLASDLSRIAGNVNLSMIYIVEIAKEYPQADIPGKLDDHADFQTVSITIENRIVLAKYFKEKGRGYPVITLLKPVAASLSPEATLLLADGYLTAGDYANSTAVAESLNKWKVPAPARGGACVIKAKSLLKQKKLKEAETLADSCLADFKSSTREILEVLADIKAALGEFDNSVWFLRKLIEQYPDYPGADEILLKIARVQLAAGAREKALATYKNISTRYPESQVSAEALFWQGMLNIKAKKTAKAEAAFLEVISRFPYSYYYYRAREELQTIGGADKIPSGYPKKPGASTLSAPAAILKSGNVLLDLNQYQLAWEEFDSAGAKYPNEASIGKSRALRNQNMLIPSVKAIEERVKVDPAFYFKVMNNTELRELLFPTMFLKIAESEAPQYPNLDAAWPLSIIRQESRFDPTATSVSNAKGLMQIMPSTGQWISTALKTGEFKVEDLYKPELNMKFGFWYFNYLITKFDGNVIFAVAGYNGGPGNVRKWKAAFGTKDMDIFVERIPKDETRNYVKKVLLNYNVYKQLLLRK